MEIKIQKCIETLNNILWLVVDKHFEKRVWVFFYQEDYAPLLNMFYELENGKNQSNSTKPRHRYYRKFEEFYKYLLRGISMTPIIKPTWMASVGKYCFHFLHTILKLP